MKKRKASKIKLEWYEKKLKQKITWFLRKNLEKFNPRARSLHYIQPWSTIVISSSSNPLPSITTHKHRIYSTKFFKDVLLQYNVFAWEWRKQQQLGRTNSMHLRSVKSSPLILSCWRHFTDFFKIAHFASISSGRPSKLISLIEIMWKQVFHLTVIFFSRQYFYHENTKLVDKKVIVFRWAMLNYSVTAIPIKLQEKDFYESK